MADFSTPLGRDAERRLPTTDERQNGFPCGAASQALFNGLFHRIESELGEVISHAGLTPDDTDFTQLRQAINALIAAATGGGNTADYLLLSQAKARLPIFPEFLTTDGRITITSPATGTIRLPGGINFMHRGISPHTTTQTDFNTDVSKTYHIRWNETDGFVMKDLADNTYNSGSLAETDVSFDSEYDDMLVARVITNSSNVATITNLANKDRMSATFTKTTSTSDPDTWSNTDRLTGNINMARTPTAHISRAVGEGSNGYDSLTHVFATVDRYTINGGALGYGFIGQASGRYQSGPLTVTVRA